MRIIEIPKSAIELDDFVVELSLSDFSIEERIEIYKYVTSKLGIPAQKKHLIMLGASIW